VVVGATGVLVHVQGGGYGSREHLFGGRPPAHHGSKLHTSASSVSCESCSSRELADPPSTSSEEKGQIFRQVFDEFSRLSFCASRFHLLPNRIQYYNCGQNRSEIAATSIGLIKVI
jgi:hypothetical protein